MYWYGKCISVIAWCATNADKVSALVLYYFIANALLLLRVHMTDFLIDERICKLQFQLVNGTVPHVKCLMNIYSK